MTLDTSDIFKDWALFLDRDGVINKRIVDDYVKSWADFVFCEGAIEALKFFNTHFKRIIIVTNQQGVGKGLMTEEELQQIHEKMTTAIDQSGGRIDRIYSCTRLKSENPFCRKPNPGMALAARRDFPDINFKFSIMVGDSISDLKFGKKMGMKTALIAPDFKIARQFPKLTNLWFTSLIHFADFIRETKKY
ncbi:MAG TPA: HAD family hydrolase [Bacteroidales bacterium]|jgi:D-glycero-D-manno-heptose 1,7-bisphosphate phosphatase|nr:HAD family hydrolase [Bacteroidales bacterium]MBP7874507.1 HAD family hydrolase [Bacteroidales bacterium]MCZ2282153.1 HAD family hydrolase [Bacteroidales bacterium]HPX34070.1 HAD family hydrolase [Bacteroidales bacterium]